MFVCFRYCFDGKLFNLRLLQAKSKVWTEVLDEFLFADSMAKVAPTEEKMQKGVDQVSDSCDSYDLTISIKKAEVIHQPAPGKPYNEPTITVKGQLMTWQRLLQLKRRCKKMWIKYLIHMTATRVLQKILSLGSDYFSATFYQTYFYYKPSKYSPFTETHFCNLFTQSLKADK